MYKNCCTVSSYGDVENGLKELSHPIQSSTIYLAPSHSAQVQHLPAEIEGLSGIQSWCHLAQGSFMLPVWLPAQLRPWPCLPRTPADGILKIYRALWASLLAPAGLWKLKIQRESRVRWKEGGHERERERFLYGWTDFALPLWWVLSLFLCLSPSLSLTRWSGSPQQRPDAIRCHHWKIQRVLRAVQWNESPDWFLFSKNSLQHISQLKLFHGHHSKGNWKSMADWLRPLVINFPSLARL